jgi:hypothetical protein
MASSEKESEFRSWPVMFRVGSEFRFGHDLRGRAMKISDANKNPNLVVVLGDYLLWRSLRDWARTIEKSRVHARPLSADKQGIL